MFKKDTKLAVVKRMSYSTSSGYKKSEYSETGNSYYGHLKALSIQNTINNNSFGKDYQFNTDIIADIKEADLLVIDGVNYTVKGVSEYDGLTFNRKMILLNRTDIGN